MNDSAISQNLGGFTASLHLGENCGKFDHLEQKSHTSIQLSQVNLNVGVFLLQTRVLHRVGSNLLLDQRYSLAPPDYQLYLPNITLTELFLEFLSHSHAVLLTKF